MLIYSFINVPLNSSMIKYFSQEFCRLWMYQIECYYMCISFKKENQPQSGISKRKVCALGQISYQFSDMG